MKIDRLLGIIIYLLNHERANANKLAERFEVSERTIQRDVEAISRAGIPILSIYGAKGGYEIVHTFKMEHQVAYDSDYSFIITALKGLSTAYHSPKIEAVIEKILSVSRKEADASNIFLDFGVLRENSLNEKADINKLLKQLESAINAKVAVSFDYTNADGTFRRHEVEPIALTYKWYAWYLFAFSNFKRDYRLYKLIRMTNVNVTDHPFLQSHENAEILLKKHDAEDDRKYIEIKLKCKAEVKMLAVEYLKGKIEKEFDSGDFILNLRLPENELLWFGTILALGNKAVVLEPERVKKLLCEKAKEILKTYS